ncbi:MAG TPA: universal stress protein [Bryobacteraceae bacterium]|nr:universal stress protein [Bryobacteraceae bacterium]
MRLLFPTSFSDACFRTSRAVAQLADICGIHLTIAHVAKPGAATIGTRRELDSFMAEADHYDHCRRVLIEAADPVEAIGELCDHENFDLVLAPASDRLGLQRLISASTRARLINRCKAPVWTAGKCLDRSLFKSSIQTIACLLDFDCPTDNHLRLASALAWRTGAKLRVVTLVSDADEGTLVNSLYSRAPLMPDVAAAQIRSAFVGLHCPEVDVAVGDAVTELPRMLSRCDADVAFIGPGQALGGGWSTRLAPYLDRLPCPAICVDGASASFEGWSFQAGDSRAVAAHGQAMAS